MKSRRMLWIFLVSVFGFLAVAAQADETVTPVGSRDQVDDLMNKYNLNPTFEKLGRGAGNFLGGWLEIPLNIHNRYSESDIGTSFFSGTAHGVVKAFVRTGVGFYEVLTFFLPYPENYAPILPTLPYYQKSARRKPLLWE